MMKRYFAAFPLLAAGCAHRHVALSTTPAAVSTQRQVLNAVDAGDGDYELRTLRAKLDADVGDIDSRIALALRYQRLGFSDVALEHLRLACERAPQSGDAHIALAKLLRDQNRPAEGAALLERLNEKSASAWAWLGVLRDAAGNFAGGEVAHREAIALEPSHDDLHNNLGYCLLLQGRNQEASAEFQTALRLNGQSVFARNNLGVAIASDAKRPDSKEAVVHLQSVTDPASAHNNVAVALLEAGKYTEARAEIQAALGYNRHHSAALNNLQLVSELEGKPAKNALPARPEGAWTHVARAWNRFWGDLL